MRVLVTGATGFTGGRLAEMLRERGDHVSALVRPSADAARLKAAGVDLIEGDITNEQDVRRAADGCEVIYHIAALYRSAKHPDSVYHDVNVTGTAHVLAAAKEINAARVVHCSTVGVHGDIKAMPGDETAPYAPGDIYQRTKLEGEKLAQQAAADGMPVAIARPAGIYGPGDLRFLKLFKTIHSGRFRMIGSGEIVYHFTYVDDLCRGFMLCAEKPEAVGDPVILCSDDYHPIADVAKWISESVGTRLRGGSIPLGPVMLAATVCESVCKPLGIEPPLFRRRLDFFKKNRAFSNAKAKRLLGFEAQVGLREGIARTAAWYFDQGYLQGPQPEALAEQLDRSLV